MAKTQLVRQTMFTTGEVDVINYKRTDYQDYLTCAQSLLNAEVGTTGLAKKRKGSKFLNNTTIYTDPNSQLFEFVDKNGNFYIVMAANLKFEIFTIVGDVVTHYATVTSPYLSADLATLDYANDNDVLIFAHSKYPPARIYVVSYGPVVFAYQVLNIYPFPSFDFGNINYNTFTVSATQAGSVLTFSFTGLGSDPGFTSAWVGGQIIGGGTDVNNPVGYAIITNVSAFAGGTVTFTAAVQINFLSPGSTSGSQYSVRQPAWSTALGWPAAVIFYQNRLWFANTLALNNTIFGSKINSPVNYDVGIGRDTDAIIYTIGQSNSGGILWLNGGKQLEIYCQNYEFAAPQELNIGLTPSSFSIRQQSAFGANFNMKPVTYLNDSYYASKAGNAIINFRFNGIGQTYTSSNISVASSHLVKNPINRALLRGTDNSQDNFVYYLNSDSTVTAFQFAAEYKLAALTPVQFQTDANNNPTVQVLDVVSINNEIYFLKFLTLTGTYFIDKFVNDFKIDSYTTASMPSNGIITGLGIFEGYKIQVVLTNQDYGEYTVVGGQITVDNMGASGTVQLGFLYPFEVIPMFIDGSPMQKYMSGGQTTYDYKRITQIYVDYYNSLNFFINGILVNYQIFADIQAGLPITPQTGTAVNSPVRGANMFDTFVISQNAPFDCQILAISYQVDSHII